MRARRRWYERWRVRAVKRCKACGLRFVYPHVPGSRPSDPRMRRIVLIGLLFLVLAVVGPVIAISMLPAPEGGALID